MNNMSFPSYSYYEFVSSSFGIQEVTLSLMYPSFYFGGMENKVNPQISSLLYLYKVRSRLAFDISTAP